MSEYRFNILNENERSYKDNDEENIACKCPSQRQELVIGPTLEFQQKYILKHKTYVVVLVLPF